MKFFVFLRAIMELMKRATIKLLVILLSFYFINNGISHLIYSSVKNHIALNHTNDVEIPQLQYHINFIEDDDCVVVFRFNTSCLYINSDNFLFSSNITAQESTDSIWQPPKIV
jgi:hypothetical protein